MLTQIIIISAVVALTCSQITPPASDNNWCKFPYHLRGRWVMMPRDRSNTDTGHYVHVRESHIQIDLLVSQGSEMVTKSNILYCKEAPENEYHFMLATADGSQVLCLQFPVVMDTNVQYEVRRTNYADQGQSYFDPTTPAKANPVIADTCNMYRNSGIPLRRSFPGKCKIPKSLLGKWNYGGAEFDGMAFTDSTVTVDESGGISVPLTCERSDYNPVDDVYMFAYRARNVTTDASGKNKDGVLCLKVKMDEITGTTTVHRFNSGTVVGGAVRVIDYFKPIYMQDPDTCDLLDLPKPGVVITQRPEVTV